MRSAIVLFWLLELINIYLYINIHRNEHEHEHDAYSFAMIYSNDVAGREFTSIRNSCNFLRLRSKKIHILREDVSRRTTFEDRLERIPIFFPRNLFQRVNFEL